MPSMHTLVYIFNQRDATRILHIVFVYLQSIYTWYNCYMMVYDDHHELSNIYEKEMRPGDENAFIIIACSLPIYDEVKRKDDDDDDDNACKSEVHHIEKCAPPCMS